MSVVVHWPFTSVLAATNRQRSDGKPTCSGQARRVEDDPLQTHDQKSSCKRQGCNSLALASLFGSLRLNPELLDEWPPFLGISLHHRAKHLRRLAITWKNFVS
jgi:hypothetical protein